MVPIDKVYRSSSTPTKSQPAGIAVTQTSTYIATSGGLEIHPSSQTHPGATTAVAAISTPNGGDIVAFGSGAKKVTIASVSESGLKVDFEVEDNKGEILALAFSKDGSLLAAGDVSAFIMTELPHFHPDVVTEMESHS
jgi:WD40 repeat protein